MAAPLPPFSQRCLVCNGLWPGIIIALRCTCPWPMLLHPERR